MDWQCQKCSMRNEQTSSRCTSCGTKQSPFPDASVSNEHIAASNKEEDQKHGVDKFSTKESKIYPSIDSSVLDVNHSFDERGSDQWEQEPIPNAISDATERLDMKYSSSVSSYHEESVSNQENETIVYIPDLPLDIENSDELEQKLRHRLSMVLKIEPIVVKCYLNFGLGYCRLRSNEEKAHLVNVVGKIPWDIGDESMMISFRDKIELISYIVFKRTKGNKEIDVPSSNEIIQQWMNTYNAEKPIFCRPLNSQYSNIYLIKTESLDELLRVASNSQLMVMNQLAEVYPCADCRYLEDLSALTTENQLRDLIGKTMTSSMIPPSSLFIQLNKRMNNACIIVTNLARRWSRKDSICINNKPIRNRKTLSYRLLLCPVDGQTDADTIVRHSIFAGKVKILYHLRENLIVKVYEKNIYDDCLNQKTLKINGNKNVSIVNYTGQPNPHSMDIDNYTWYDHDMIECESNIMPFIRQPDHQIFRLNWNANNWLEQFRRIENLEKSGSTIDNDDKKSTHTWVNDMRHRLRMTVMLNTLAAVKKRCYTIDDRTIQLNLNEKQKTIVYDHTSKLELSGSMPIKRAPYEKTEVEVIEEDCLIVYENLVAQGKRPLLLNMASATMPGGGYRKGDGAQEENLFRRSDYFRSLDVDLDNFFRPSLRFYCTSRGHIEPLVNQSTMYPMDDFSAIYTSGLTVFRQPESKGYEFMAEPLMDVCSLAMAAYRNPSCDGNLLSPTFAVGMRKKIENIFAIAYHQKHDTLVLSALGCGAYKNPPDHVAKIFRSVIEQYAGFFRLIVFAIVNDHNTGQMLNPNGNLLPFQRAFQQSIFESIQPINRANTIYGPYRVSNDGSTVENVSIFDLTPCKYGAKCQDLFESIHLRQYSHPPICVDMRVNGKCMKMKDPVHMYSFIHRSPCHRAGSCRDIDNKEHRLEFEHPSYCSLGANCQDTSDDHEKEFRHLPICKNALKCRNYQQNDQQHCNAYRHCKSACPYGSQCPYFHNVDHREDWQHPFNTPCPWSPYHCAFYDQFQNASHIENLSHHIQQHCSSYSHVCSAGRNCFNNDRSHRKTTIHIPRFICPKDKNCPKLDEENHLNSFTHSNVQDIRYLCQNSSTCEEYDKSEHRSRYYHPSTRKQLSVIPYYDLNKNMNFLLNQRNNLQRIQRFITNERWTPSASGSVSLDIVDWIRTVRPMYRCGVEVFQSILVHEYVMSRAYMNKFKQPEFLAFCLMQNNQIKSMGNLANDVKQTQHVQHYVLSLVIDLYQQNQFKSDSTDYSNDQRNILQRDDQILLQFISPDDLKSIQELTKQMTEAAIKLQKSFSKTDDSSNLKSEIDKHVVGILGSYLDSTCNDIIIVFKREVLHHPDANFSIQPFVSFLSERCYQYQPWLTRESNSINERIKLFDEMKLHASMPGYEQAAAQELIVLTGYHSNQKTMNIDLQMIVDRWFNIHSQNLIEAHLPQRIPLDYIDEIRITQIIYDTFNVDMRNKIETIFGDRLKILPTMPINEYTDRIAKGSIERSKKSDLQSTVHGFVLTIPPTDFLDNLVLPLRISEAYKTYRMYESKTSSKDLIIYIYWQVNNGDMMLTLSKASSDPNDFSSKTRSLICYIAEKPNTSINEYREYPSYLTLGQPFQHQTFIDENRFAAQSTSFYLGCHLNQLLTFCLEIQPSNGVVTLSHAGPNSIYNYETLTCTFSKSTFDLSELEYLHVNAGKRQVSIQNLFITFEKQEDLHPKVDLKLNPTVSLKKMRSNEAQADQSRETSDASSSSIVDYQQKGSTGIINQVKTVANQIKDKTMDYLIGKKDPPVLIPCRYGIHCLIQYSEENHSHNSKYSHPCRFADLCQNREAHLTHEAHPVIACSSDRNCKRLNDVYHRAAFLHSGLPFFLIPCRYQKECTDKSDKHRIKYSHGEKLLEPNGKPLSKESSNVVQRDNNIRLQPIPCRNGSMCSDKRDPRHCARYSHPGSLALKKVTNNPQPDSSGYPGEFD